MRPNLGQPKLRLVVPDEPEDSDTLPFRMPAPLPPVRDSVHAALSAMDSVSRRMDDLARQLNCLGHFGNDDSDPPRAA